MKRNKKRIMVAVLAICALAAGGAAFTASLGTGIPSSQVAGFGQTHIIGDVADSTHYVMTADGQAINSVVVDFETDPTGKNVEFGFGTNQDNAVLIGGVSGGTDCSIGAQGSDSYDTGANAATDYPVTCNFNSTTAHDYIAAAVGGDTTTPNAGTSTNNGLDIPGEPVALANYFDASVTDGGSTLG